MQRLSKYLFALLLLLPVRGIAQGQLQEGIEYYRGKQWAKAEAFFTRASQRDPGAMLPCHYLAAVLLEQGKYSEAYRVLAAGVTRHPAEKSLTANFITAGIQLRRYEQPVAAALAFLKLHPGDTDIRKLTAAAYLSQAEDYRAAGKYSQALTAAARARTYNPADERIGISRVYALLGMGEVKTALKEAAAAAKAMPLLTSVQLAYISALSANQQYEAALAKAEAIAPKLTGDVDFRLQLVMLYRAAYKVREAEALVNVLLNSYPAVERVYDGAVQFYESINNGAALRAVYEKKIAAFGHEAECRLAIARSFETERNWQEAFGVYYGILAKQESDSVRYLAARLYYKQGQFDSAAVQLRLLLNLFPRYYPAHTLLVSLYRKTNQPVEMLAAAGEMLKHYPNDFAANLYMSRAELLQKNFARAETLAQTAADLRKNSPYPLDVIGDIRAAEQNMPLTLITAKRCARNTLARVKETEQELRGMLQQVQAGGQTADNERGSALKEELDELKVLFKKCIARTAARQSANEQRAFLFGLLAAYPASPLVLPAIGAFYAAIGEQDSALFFYTQALEKNPMVAEVHMACGDIHAIQGHFRLAMDSYRRAVAADTSLSGAYDSLIHTALQCGAGEELADSWLSIYRTNRGNTALRERLIELLHKTNRFEEASNLIQESKQ